MNILVNSGRWLGNKSMKNGAVKRPFIQTEYSERKSLKSFCQVCDLGAWRAKSPQCSVEPYRRPPHSRIRSAFTARAKPSQSSPHIKNLLNPPPEPLYRSITSKHFSGSEHSLHINTSLRTKHTYILTKPGMSKMTKVDQRN